MAGNSTGDNDSLLVSLTVLPDGFPAAASGFGYRHPSIGGFSPRAKLGGRNHQCQDRVSAGARSLKYGIYVTYVYKTQYVAIIHRAFGVLDGRGRSRPHRRRNRSDIISVNKSQGEETREPIPSP